MSIAMTTHHGTVSPTGRLTHEQAVALLEILAHLVDSDWVEGDILYGSLGPSRMPAVVTAMEAVGVEAAVIHAYEQTGILVGEGNEDLWSAGDLRRWEAAVTGYRNGTAPAQT
jgi:hypothetical protein